jgi:NADH:ubiquinone oxidoreductase subunit 3 (subunit A)
MDIANPIMVTPIAFLIILALVMIAYRALRAVSPKTEQATGTRKAYGCGEDWPEHRVRPDYSRYFIFAFFFTIMHAVAMMVATIPRAASIGTLAMAIAFVSAAILSLFILFRR